MYTLYVYTDFDWLEATLVVGNWAMNLPVARIPIRSYTTMSSFASIDIFSIVPIPTNYMELQNVMPTEGLLT